LTLRPGRRLPRRWYERPAPDLAPDLLGRVLVRHFDDGTVAAVRIVETEAYTEDDPASHAFRGPTPRNAVMFGPPGRVYVYLSYGMHHCMNVIAGSDGVGTAVLLRAGAPLAGVEQMAAARGRSELRVLASGPGRLCQALRVDRGYNNADLVRGPALTLHEGTAVRPAEVRASTRVGIRVGVDRMWRFSIAGDPHVSRVRGSGDPSALRVVDR
jgi:DNA-3-methyladenine glycosylase